MPTLIVINGELTSTHLQRSDPAWGSNCRLGLRTSYFCKAELEMLNLDLRKWQMLGLAKLKTSCKIQNSKKRLKEIPRLRGQSPSVKAGEQASR